MIRLLALGARSSDVFGLVLRNGMALVATGTALGLLGAAAVPRLLTSLLYGTGATHPTTFVATTAVLTVVAFVANLIPARRATKVDPLTALRYE